MEDRLSVTYFYCQKRTQPIFNSSNPSRTLHIHPGMNWNRITNTQENHYLHDIFQSDKITCLTNERAYMNRSFLDPQVYFWCIPAHWPNNKQEAGWWSLHHKSGQLQNQSLFAHCHFPRLMSQLHAHLHSLIKEPLESQVPHCLLKTILTGRFRLPTMH